MIWRFMVGFFAVWVVTSVARGENIAAMVFLNLVFTCLILAKLNEGDA